MKVHDEIEDAGRSRGTWMTGPRNVEANVESLKFLDVAGGTSAEGAVKSTEVECRRRSRRGRREAR
jgi:hypothetical protein